MGGSLLKKNGPLHPDSITKCNILADQFKSFLQRTQRTPIATPNCMNQHSPQIPELNENSCRALTHLRPQDKKKCHSASFMTSRILVPCFTWLFKQTHSTGKLPSGPLPGFRWLFRSDAFNCAPVSLTCVPYKLFKHILCPHIRAHLDAQLSNPRNSLNSRPTVSHYTHPPLPPGWLYRGDTYGAAWIWGGSLLIERGRNNLIAVWINRKKLICVKCTHCDFTVSPGSAIHKTGRRVVFFTLISWFNDILVLSYFKSHDSLRLAFLKIAHE